MNKSNFTLLDIPESDEAFNEFCNDLIQYNASTEELKDLGLLCKDNYERAIRLLHMALTNALNDKEENKEPLILLCAIYEDRNTDTSNLLKKLKNSEDPRVSILKGFHYYKAEAYDDAKFEFSKINYTKGINLCNLKLREIEEVEAANDTILCSFIDSKKWKEVDVSKVCSQDYLYRIGKSETYEDEKSIDVILANLKFTEDELNVLLSLKNDNSEIYTAEIDYSIGKIYHLRGEYDNAAYYYKESLNADSNYLPSYLNLSKINDTPVDITKLNTKDHYAAIFDHNALIALKKFNFNFDYSKCSSEIKSIFKVVDACEKVCIKGIELLEEYLNSDVFDRTSLENNLGVLYSKKFDEFNAVRMFTDALNSNRDPKKENYLKYNLYLIEKDWDKMKTLELEEAKYQIAFNNNKCGGFPMLEAYSLMDTERSKSLAYFTNSNDLFSSLCLSHLMIQEGRLDDSIDICMKHSKSYFAINNLAISNAKKGFVDNAIRLLLQVKRTLLINNHPFIGSLYVNLGNCYYMNNEYDEAINYYLKTNTMSDYVDRMLISICYKTKYIEYVERCIDRIPDLKKYKIEILLTSKKFQEARDFAKSESLYDEMIDSFKAVEEDEIELKKQIKEMEEYRKKKNI